MRSKDLATLSGLEQVYSAPVEDTYVSTDDRELQAYYQSLLHAHESDEMSDEDIAALRSAL